MRIERFRITTPEADLLDLKDRLARTRWPEDVDSAGWSQGTNRSYLRELTTFWEQQFNWRRQESRLNAFGHFRADVGGLKLHFVHEKGTGPSAIPLVLVHGWRIQARTGAIQETVLTSSCHRSPAMGTRMLLVTLA